MTDERDDDPKTEIIRTIAELLDRMEPVIGWEKATYEIAVEALSQLATEVGIEAAAMVAETIAARMKRSARQ